MSQELIIVFLLFFAVLAAAWFYLQRAKARTDTTVTTTEPTEPTEPAAAATEAPTEPPDERSAS
jgi:hypothetical protein